jgi:hypothetical protein
MLSYQLCHEVIYGKAVPTVEMGEGSPLGGVLPWMEYDEYYVYGGYMQVKGDAYLLQGEYWRSPHSGRRDPDKVLQLFDPALGLNAAQRERFGFDAVPVRISWRPKRRKGDEPTAP